MINLDGCGLNRILRFDLWGKIKGFGMEEKFYEMNIYVFYF